jgi:formate hydrogenlyase subunit 6/NADH:ubiquinone oxidoreductase subunit I
MFKTIRNGFMKKGVVTDHYPDVPYVPYDGHFGTPVIDGAKCQADKECEKVCPTSAIQVTSDRLSIDLGLCIFCGECARGCPQQAIIMSKEFELASKVREGLVRSYVFQH